MRVRLAAVAVASLFAVTASAQSPAQQSTAASPVGTWRGTSLCLVRPSSCNDEVVVYRITRTTSPDSVAVDGRRIVRGEEQEMGVLTCRLMPPNGFTCSIPQGVWHFSVGKDSLVGELRRPDNARFRDVRAIRTP